MTSDTWMSPLCSLVFFCSCRDKMWDITITLWTEFNSSDGSSHKLMLIWMCVRFIWIHLFFYETMLCCCWVNKAHRWFTYRYLKKNVLKKCILRNQFLYKLVHQRLWILSSRRSACFEDGSRQISDYVSCCHFDWWHKEPTRLKRPSETIDVVSDSRGQMQCIP